MTRVLVVDDEPSVAGMIAALLRDSGYDVLVTYDGAAALASYERQGADAVIADFLLPKLDGGALIRALVALPTPPRCTVIMSELDTAYLRKACPRCDAYLQKPFTVADLNATLLTCLTDRVPPPRQS